MSLSPKILIPAIAAMAAIAAFFFLVLSPKRDEATRLDGEIAAKQSQLDQSLAQAATTRRPSELQEELHDAHAAREGCPGG